MRYLTLLISLPFLLVVGCEGPTSHVTRSSNRAITSFAFLEPAAVGAILPSTSSIEVLVPFGTDLTHLVPTITFTGAKVMPASLQAQDFRSPVNYVVTAEDGSSSAYTVRVATSQSTTKAITSFAIVSPGSVGVISESTHEIAITVPYGTSLKALVPTIGIAGVAITPASGIAQDFSVPLHYIVTASDGSQQDYLVAANVAASSAKSISSFTFETPVATGAIAESGHRIVLTVPYGTKLSSLTPTITITGASITPASGQSQNFSDPVTYTVRASDGSAQEYLVSVTVAANPAKAITSFRFPAMGINGTIDESAGLILVQIPENTDFTRLVPAIDSDGVSLAPASGVATDFSVPVAYVVTAADGTTRKYTVTVTATPTNMSFMPVVTYGGFAWTSIGSSADGVHLAACVSNGEIYTSDDSGMTWTNRESGGRLGWACVTVSGDGSVIVAGVYGRRLYASWDRGISWTVLSAPARYWTSIRTSFDGKHIIASDGFSELYSSADGGQTWLSETATGGDRPYKHSIAVTPDGRYVASAWGGSGMIRISDDYGATWAVRSVAGVRNWSGIATSIDGVHLFAVEQGGGIWVSGDRGLSWTVLSTAGTRNWFSIAASADGNVLAAAVLGGGIWVSRDSGSTWTEQTASRDWQSLVMSADGQRLSAAVAGGDLWTSGDAGVLWTKHQVSGKRAWGSVASSSDGRRLVAVPELGGVFTSSDFGETWVDHRDTLSNLYWSEISTSASGQQILVGKPNGHLFTSNDYGETWNERPGAGTLLWYRTVVSRDGQFMAAMEVSGAMAVSSDSGMTWASRNALGGYSLGISADAGLMVVSREGLLSTSADRGLTWTPPVVLWTGGNSSDPTYLAVSADGRHCAAASMSGKLFTSADSGKTWIQRKFGPSRTITDLSGNADGSHLAVTTPSGLFYSQGDLYTSCDYGATWTRQSTSGVSSWTSLAMDDRGEHLVAATDWGGFTVSR